MGRPRLIAGTDFEFVQNAKRLRRRLTDKALARLLKVHWKCVRRVRA